MFRLLYFSIIQSNEYNYSRRIVSFKTNCSGYPYSILLLLHISAKRDKKCWFQDKVFFIDINSGNIDYKLTIDILSQHGARIDLFLSKDVSHIVKNYQERRAIENSKISKSFNNSRAARMIQASLINIDNMHQDNSIWLTPTHSRLNGPNPRIYIKSLKQNSETTTSLYVSFISNIDNP